GFPGGLPFQFPGGGGQFPGGGFDPRSLDGGGRGGPGRPPGGFTRRRGKPTNILADETPKTGYVNGPAEDGGQAKARLQKFDVAPAPGAKELPTGPSFETYPVPAGSADAMAQVIRDATRGSQIVRVTAVTANQLMVYATAAEHLEIAELIGKGNKAANETSQTIEITGMAVGDGVSMLKAMFPAQEKGGPYIGAHPNGTGVVVRGKPEQVRDVELVLSKGIGVTSDAGPGIPGGGNTRIINLKDGSAGDLAEAVRMILEGMGQPSKGLRPEGSAVPPPVKTPPPPKEIPKSEAPGEKKGGVERGAMKGYGLGVRDLDTSRMLAMGGGQLVDPAAKSKPVGAPVVITAIGDRLIITGDDPKAVAVAHEIAQLIVKGKGESWRVCRFENATAPGGPRVINACSNPPQQQNRNQNPFQFTPFGIGGGGPFGGGRGQESTTPEKPRVRVVAEQSSNSLL